MKGLSVTVVAAAACLCTPSLAQIVPDRATATIATAGPGGRTTVSLAPANASGISHNTYTDFSVQRPGVDLNNRGVDATTIVNEVTSTRRSLIQGPVEVLGSRAHVVLANPNGITIDGGSFINTGGVALSGGAVRFDPTASGRVNTVLPTGSGDILVTGRGLSGAMTTLQLIAGRIRIDGKVANHSISPNADIALVAGRSEVTLNSTVSPLTTLRSWASTRRMGGGEDDILVDVTPRGSLSASRVHVSVSGKGAGVSFAGHGQAAIGDFTISADGKIATRGAIVKAQRGLKLEGASIEILNDARRQSDLTSVTRGVVLLAQAGDITLHGAVTGVERTEDDRDSQGGVTLKASNNIKLSSANAKRLAIAFSSKDDLVIESGGNLINDTGRLLSNATTIIRTTGTIANTADPAPSKTETQTILRRHSGLFGSLFRLKRRITVTSMEWKGTRIPGQVGYIAGKAVDVRAGRIENSGEIDALDGSLILAADSIVNTAFYMGSVRFAKNCGITCWSYGSSTIETVGGKINATGSAEIVASENVENSGDIVAYGNLSVTANVVAAHALVAPEFANRPSGFYNGFAGKSALVSLTPVGGGFYAPSGTVTITTTKPVILSGGTVKGQVATEIPAGTDEGQSLTAAFPGGLHHIGLMRFWLD